MICLRCGHCCLTYAIVIVRDPKLGISKDNLDILDGTKRCPHLIGNKVGEYSCKVHDEEWYEDTPCFSHTQIERGNTPCRMGQYLINQEKKNT